MQSVSDARSPLKDCMHCSANLNQLAQDQPTRDQPQPAWADFGKTCIKKCAYTCQASSCMANTPSKFCPHVTRTSSTLLIFKRCAFTKSAITIGALCESPCEKAMLRNFCSASACFSTGIPMFCHAVAQSFGFRAAPSHNLRNTSSNLASLSSPPLITGSSANSPMRVYNWSSPPPDEEGEGPGDDADTGLHSAFGCGGAGTDGFAAGTLEIGAFAADAATTLATGAFAAGTLATGAFATGPLATGALDTGAFDSG
mmetsp:Transcript_49006/g.140864  ORF Transcript_49006/g.140864 Transcript_49006/m.140864 type:complete len:256 (-) Transcript_49006:222-989(-)